MSEIPKEELERIEKAATVYTLNQFIDYGDHNHQAEEQINLAYRAGAKAEHSHLQGRIAEKAQSFASWVANWAEYHEKMAKTKLSFKELWNIYKSVNP